MKRLNWLTHMILSLAALLALCSCVHEFPVTDHSFAFGAEITYDESSLLHRLTLTRKAGMEDNSYSIAFTLDGHSTITLEDMEGRTLEGSFTEEFKDVSARTYTLSEVTPGEHVLHLDIRTEQYSQSLDVPFTVEDHSFLFDYGISFDEETKTHSLEVTLKEGDTSDRYTVSYTIDNAEPVKTFSEDFSKDLSRSYALAQTEPGEHTVNLTVSTDKHIQKADIPYTVNDYSFSFKADIEYDSDNLSHILFLTLLKGSRDETYTVSYTVDEGYLVKLTDISGRELSGSFVESFRDATVRSYDLSRAGKGEHLMKMTISTDDYSQQLEIPYEVVALPFSFHLETNTSGTEGTEILLTLKEGDPATEYQTTLTLDGEPYGNAVKVNFSKTPIYRVLLPTIRPGRHEIAAALTDGHTQESLSDDFSEPVRHPYIDISLDHQESSGRYTASIGKNPYGIELSLVTSLTLTGVSTYCVSTHEYYYFDIRYKQKTKSMNDSSTSEEVFEDETISLIDHGGLVAKLTSQYEMSNVMTYCQGQGDGECVEPDYWEKSGTERAYYVLTEDDLEIDIGGERVTGVSLRVTNNIGKMTLNGKASESGTTTITL